MSNPKGGVVIRGTGPETVGSLCKNNTSHNAIGGKTDQLFIRRPNNQKRLRSSLPISLNPNKF